MSTPLIIPDRILRFLNALPVTGEPLEWIPAFRDELCVLLGDVDRVTVNINLSCDFQNPEQYRADMFITRLTSRVEEDGTVVVAQDTGKLPPSERLLDYMRTQGFPVELYHEPHIYNYYVGKQAYLGTVFLWREKNREPISNATRELVASLEPFFIFVFSDIVARRQYAEPADRTFLDALNSLIGAAGLSKQEQRVIILQLFGHSYKEIADVLGVSVDGVKHHLKMIHRKTGARSYTELFAKYFMPRFDLRDNDEDLEEQQGIIPQIKPEGRVITAPSLHNGVYFISDTTLGDRLRKFGEAVYGSIEDFARALKVAPSNLQKYFNGERNPGLAMLQRLHELGCNINGLISGEGAMFADNDPGRALWSRFGVSPDLEVREDEGEAEIASI